MSSAEASVLSKSPKASSHREQEDPVWTILPSYYMYQSTFSGEADPPQYTEDLQGLEPQSSDCSNRVISTHESNELSAVSTSVTGSSINVVGAIDSRNSSGSASEVEESFIVADEASSSWRETILDNVSHMRNLSYSDNKKASEVQLSIYFTKDVGEPGVKPDIIDPSLYEYKQGDFLNGYILIKNVGSEPIPFDMFYVHFDGNFIVADSENSESRRVVKLNRFLEMYDFAASWNPACVERMPSEDPSMWLQLNYRDPLDGTYLAIGLSRTVNPGATYKRFFTFKIPTRLLDSECNNHNISSHTELPPTIGLSREERARLLKKNEKIDDLSFLDTSISYGLWARFIGKASKYGADDVESKAFKLINAKGDEFVILKEAGSFIRVLQETKIVSDSERKTNNEVARITYNCFVQQIKDAIALGNEIVKALNDGVTQGSAIEVAQNKLRDESTKLRQLYSPTSGARDIKVRYLESQTYDVAISYKKINVFGKSKEVGSLMLSSPKIEYVLSYISPTRFRTRSAFDPSSWKVEIPIELTYVASNARQESDCKAPEINFVFGELVVFTLKSNKRPIPIDLTHDILFKNISKTCDGVQTLDNYTQCVKLPMRKHAGEIYDLLKRAGTENMAIPKNMVEDLAALANSVEKYNRLVLKGIQTIDEDGARNPCKKGVKIPWNQYGAGQFKKKFSLSIDVSKARKMTDEEGTIPPSRMSYDEFTLVPSFQNCFMSRLYYFRISLGLTGGQFLELKLPVRIAKVGTQ